MLLLLRQPPLALTPLVEAAAAEATQLAFPKRQEAKLVLAIFQFQFRFRFQFQFQSHFELQEVPSLLSVRVSIHFQLEDPCCCRRVVLLPRML